LLHWLADRGGFEAVLPRFRSCRISKVAGFWPRSSFCACAGIENTASASATSKKKINGRKRHIAVDTDWRLLMVNLTTADIADSAGARAILDAIRKRWLWIKHLFADGVYDRRKLMDKAALEDFVIEIVRRIDSDPGFKVLPRRWVVERTFGK